MIEAFKARRNRVCTLHKMVLLANVVAVRCVAVIWGAVVTGGVCLGDVAVSERDLGALTVAWANPVL